MKKKILLLIIGTTLLFSGCGQKDEVESWQDANNFGEINENIDVTPLYEWGVQSDDLIIDKHINLEEENTYKTLTAGIFEATWNYYADDKYKITKWETNDLTYNKTYKAQVGDRRYSVYIEIKEINNEIYTASISFSNNITFEESCKYSTLAYYILSPFESKTNINDSIKKIYAEDHVYFTKSSDVKSINIRSELQEDGRKIDIEYIRFLDK